MSSLNCNQAIVPIVLIDKEGKPKELLGTGFFVNTNESLVLITAKHVFEMKMLEKGDMYAFCMPPEDKINTGTNIFYITKYESSDEYDIAYSKVGNIEKAIHLTLRKERIARNENVVTHEYSNTFMETIGGKKRMTFSTSMYKGNIVRYYMSDYPEPVETPVFITSFPALQGASGAPVIFDESIEVVGMLSSSASKEPLLPAQTIRIEEEEEIKYYLPQGKAICSEAIIDYLESERIIVL